MKKLNVNQFAEEASSNDCAIVLVDGLWQARCTDGVLCKPDGDCDFSNLPGLMSILAGVGIRRCVIEWDGLPAWSFDQNC